MGPHSPDGGVLPGRTDVFPLGTAQHGPDQRPGTVRGLQSYRIQRPPLELEKALLEPVRRRAAAPAGAVQALGLQNVHSLPGIYRKQVHRGRVRTGAVPKEVFVLELPRPAEESRPRLL